VPADSFLQSLALERHGRASDPGQMAKYHRASDSDRLLTARLMGVAKRHAPWREPDPGRDERRGARTCPVSLKMRHGQRHYLRCLKYMRQLALPVVSPIVRQVCKSPTVSYQVSGAGASFL
jgi:hypothetical protein